MTEKVYSLIYSPTARKDARKIAQSNLREKCSQILEVIETNPYANPPPYEKLSGDIHGCVSRRLNIHHRLIYEVIPKDKTIKVLRMWSHYE